MKTSADDFKRAYAELSDEGLLSIDRGDLVEIAQQCYDEELARRGLTAEAEQSAAALPDGPLVEVARFDNFGGLESAREVLQWGGFPGGLTPPGQLPGQFI